MNNRKYGVASAVKFCFRYAPGASSIKLVLEAVGGALVPLMVIVVAAFIDGAVALASGGEGVAPLATAIVLMAAYYAYSQFAPVIARLADRSLTNALSENLRPQLVEKHARTDFALLEDPETLDLIERVLGGVEARMVAIFDSAIRIVKTGIEIAGTLSLLAAHVWWMLPLFLLSAVPISIIAHRGGKAIYESDVVTTKLTRRHYYLSGILTGREAAAERTLFGYTDEINKKFSSAHLMRSNMVTREIALKEVAINACGLVLNALVLIAVFALLVPVGEGTLSQGLYVSLVGALIGLARVIRTTVSRLTCDATGYVQYMREFTRFLALPEAERDVGEPIDELGAHFESLEIRDLRFRYTPESQYVLKGVNLRMDRGRSYSLIGQNGAGKSTLVKILLGLYRDFEGEILINGRDISSCGADELRRIFSVVYQDFARYYIPLGDNITLGRDRGDLNSVLEISELHEVAERFPKGAETPLGKIFEGGVDISGGEWQKVAIARALYADTPFMILDEPTASLSPAAESRLYRRFGEITRDRTSLFISHRLGSTKLSDVLLVLEDGIIAETGSHEELMAAGGIYAGMFKSQRSWYDERQ